MAQNFHGPLSVRRHPASRAFGVCFIACLLLLVQFLLGMAVNLFVTIPGRHPGAGAHDFFSGISSGVGWAVASGPFWLAAHVILGLALVLAAFVNLAWSTKLGSRRFALASFVGAMAIVGAAFNGASFVNYGHDFSSMIMAGLWALSSASYLTCMYIAARSQWDENANVIAVGQTNTDVLDGHSHGSEPKGRHRHESGLPTGRRQRWRR
jgi:hypothetical protein